MVEKEPTFEEYKKASAFAKFRYKYGLIIQLLCLLCFIILIIFVIIYSRELAMHPLIYGADKYDVECICRNYETGRSWFVNSTDLISNYFT